MAKSLAISYSMKKKKKKEYKEGDKSGRDKGVHSSYPQESRKGKSVAGEITRDAREYPKDTWAKKNELAKTLHANKIEELKEMKGPSSGKSGFAEGGEVFDGGAPAWVCSDCGSHSLTFSGHQDGAHSLDMVGRALQKRKMNQGGMCYSKGGQVANDSAPVADGLPAEFDDLVLRDDEEMEGYTGANSGDNIGGPSKDDLVARAMIKRKKK